MKNISNALLSVLLLTFVTGCRSGNHDGEVTTAYPRTPNFKYNELMLKDYDEMSKMVRNQIRKAQAATKDGDDSGVGEAISELQVALKMIFSRPDSDNMVAKLAPEVRRELVGFSAFETAIGHLAHEALDNLRAKNAAVSVQTSAVVVLENILGEIRPEAERGNPGLRTLVQTIADARIELNDDVKRERKLRGMFQSKSPSEEARVIMKGIETREAAEKKAARKKKK